MMDERNLKKFFEEQLANTVANMEAIRKEKADKFRKFLNSAAILAALLLFSIMLLPYLVLIIPLLVSMFWLLGMALQTYSEMNKQLRMPFKYKVLVKVIGHLFDNHTYIANQRIAKSVIVKSMLFPRFISGVRGEDFMQFSIGKTRIMFCESKVFGTRKKLFFRGIFVASTFNKYFKSKTFVISKKSSNYLLRIKRRVFQKMQKVDLENIEFNKHFFTFASDQVEARYILTPGFMERVLKYNEKAGKALSMSFVDNRLYCAIPKFYDLFEVPFLKPIDYECIKNTIAPVLLYTDLVEDLNLNLRIWSKQ